MASRTRTGVKGNPFGIQGTAGMADMSRPQAQRMAATHVANMYDRTPKPLQTEGRLWYPKVHDATAKGAKQLGISTHHAAGIVAAVSPNMDWDRNNIDAFGELSSLKPHEWDAIHRAHAAGLGATPEVKSILKGKGISAAPVPNLVKAHRIMQGEHPDVVLPRRTAPKTNAFARNIADPGSAGPVTIDGRAHDIAVNSLRPWTSSRGINSADLARGGTSRYEHFEGAYRNAAAATGELPHDMQAITWVGGKALERSGVTKSGKPRKVGVRRVGQGYTDL